MTGSKRIDDAGSFYLGRRHDLGAGRTLDEPLLYDSKDLTTHAVCVGMTGSGKTGLCLSLLEEAALDGIPAIAIDPKGDLGNLLLAFPNLEPADFRPWVDESEAARKQMSTDEFAAAQARLWREGLAKWDQSPERIRRYCDATERIIYTPGSTAGIPVSILDSFHAPPAEIVGDQEALGDRVLSAVSGLLALLGIAADPVRSREHVFLASIFSTAWRAGRGLDLAQLMRHIQRPPIDRVGVLDVEAFYPAAERSKLAMGLNSLIASPSFATWLDGEPLDIGRMLYTPAGKPRLAVVSIAHLDDAQRMFFVTLLLNEVLSWVRSQPGTSSLRAILYMDEVFGYFPPSANPPSKRPMLTLLKQARAFGLGCVLATQNPVDLDYKGLSNAGTWFIGRLQTERDKARVIEGLEGASTQASQKFNRGQMEATLAALGSRVFLMNNVHEDEPVVFHTRWALSYLCGPLAREKIKRLMDPLRSKFAQAGNSSVSETAAANAGRTTTRTTSERAAVPAVSRSRPILPDSIREYFAQVTKRVPDDFRLEYRPGLVGRGKVHFHQAAQQIDVWRDRCLMAPIDGVEADDAWKAAQLFASETIFDIVPDAAAEFAPLPKELSRPKSYSIFEQQLKEHLYREESLSLWRCELVGANSKSSETMEQFRNRLVPIAATELAARRKQIEQRYAAKLADAEAARKRQETRLRTQRWQFFAGLGNVIWVAAETALRMMGKGRRGRPRSAGVAIRQAAGEHGHQATAQISLEQAEAEKERLEAELREQLQELEKTYDPSRLPMDEVVLQPRKGDIEVDEVALVWLPWRIDSTGRAEAAYSLLT
jgi:hypothetical protein